MPEGEVLCRENRNVPVLTPAVPTSAMDSTARNIGRKHGRNTINTNAHPMCIKNTDAHGNAFVTDIIQLILTVNAAMPKGE